MNETLPIIVGISGFSGSGKDTFADFLCARHGFTKIAMADGMKRICKDVFAFSDEQLWGPSEKRNEPDQRYVFSGICPLDRTQCTMQPTLQTWQCPTCSSIYQKFLTPRLVLQSLGTEWGRTMTDSVWVAYTLRTIAARAQKDGIQRWVIPDVRFTNEIRAIAQQPSGHVVRIVRAAQAYVHATEAEMATIPDSAFEAIIDNTGTLQQLQEHADVLARKFLAPMST